MPAGLAGRSYAELSSPPDHQASSDPMMLRSYWPVPSMSFTPACAFVCSRFPCSYPHPACPPIRSPAWGAVTCWCFPCSYSRPACPPTRSPARGAAMCSRFPCSYPHPACPPIRSPAGPAFMTPAAETAVPDRPRHNKKAQDMTPTTLQIDNMGTSSVKCETSTPLHKTLTGSFVDRARTD